MAYSKYFNAKSLIVCYEDFPIMQNLDCFDITTFDSWVFKTGKKTKIWIKQIFFVFHLCRTACNTHKTIYILKGLPQFYSKM